MENDKWKLFFCSATVGTNRKATSVTLHWSSTRQASSLAPDYDPNHNEAHPQQLGQRDCLVKTYGAH
jgi:hypothetical protein